MQPFKINLDYKQDCYEEIKVSMLDTVKIEATITDNWQTVVLTGATIQMQIGKNDGRYVIQTSNITVVGNKVSITLDEQATVLEGITELTLVINQNGERKGLWIINLSVRRTSITDKVDSVTAVPLIQELETTIAAAGVSKVNLDNSIANGNIAVMRTDVNKNTSDIVVVNEQLAENAYIYDKVSGDDLQAFLDDVVTKGGGKVIFPNAQYDFTTGFIYYHDKISLVSEKNTKFIFNMTSGVGMTIKSMNNYSNIIYAHYDMIRHHVSGIEFRTSDHNMVLVDSYCSSNERSSFWSLNNCVFIGGNIGVQIRSNTWNVNMDNCYFRDNNYGVYMPNNNSYGNYGERISIRNSTFDTCNISAIFNDNSYGNIVLINCSIDYCRKQFVTLGYGDITCNACYFEGKVSVIDNLSDENWFVNSKGRLMLNNCKIVVMSDKATSIFKNMYNFPFAPHYQSGIIINDLYLYSSYTMNDYLIDGNGRALVRNYITASGSTKPLMCSYMNQLPVSKQTFSITSKTVKQIVIPSNLSDSVVGLLSNNKVEVTREFLDSDGEVIVPNLIYKSNFTVEGDLTLGAGGGGSVTYTTENTLTGKALKIVTSNTDWGNAAKEIPVIAGHDYIICGYVKVTNYTTGGVNIQTNSISSETLQRVGVSGICDWTFCYEHFKPLTTKTIKAIPISIGSISSSNTLTAYSDKIIVIDLTVLGLDVSWWDGVLQYAKELNGNTKLIPANIFTKATGEYLTPPQGTKNIRYYISNNNDVTANISNMVINNY